MDVARMSLLVRIYYTIYACKSLGLHIQRLSPIILVHYCFHINNQSFVGIQEETTSKITTNVASSSTASKLITNSTANDTTTPRSSIGNLQ